MRGEHRGHEPAGSPVWRARADHLIALMSREPMPTVAVLEHARAYLGWGEDLTRQVLSVVEGGRAVHTGGVWRVVGLSYPAKIAAE